MREYKLRDKCLRNIIFIFINGVLGKSIFVVWVLNFEMYVICIVCSLKMFYKKKFFNLFKWMRVDGYFLVVDFFILFSYVDWKWFDYKVVGIFCYGFVKIFK